MASRYWYVAIIVCMLDKNLDTCDTVEQPTAGRLTVRSMRRAFQACGKNVANWFYSLWAKPLSRQLQGYLPATLLLGTCLATTYYMNLSSRLYDFDLDDACDSAWRTFREYTSIVL